MKPLTLSVLCAVLALAITSCATRQTAVSNPSWSGPTASGQAEPAWPLTVVNGGYTSTVYAPEIDSWDGHLMVGRSAVAVQPPGRSTPVYGIVAFQTITLVNKQARTATLADIRVVGAQFPSDPQQAQHLQQMLGAAFPKQVRGFSLDLLEASMTLTPQELAGSALPLDNTPPNIIFSTRPAILVSIDGPPAYREVQGTHLERVINCRMLLLKDPGGHFYLHLWNGYLTAPGVDGPWQVAEQPPAGVAQAESQAVAEKSVDLMQTSGTPSLSAATAPQIFVSTKPTALILFNGEPDFVPISGTHLVYASNTTGDVFKLLTNQRDYVLLSGRWFGASSLSGPWVFVPPNQLPPDFANIPDTSPKENVKASVPGTLQASEALIANSFPDSTEVPRATTMQNPQIDGPPKLQPITGTPLFYVVNSGTPIIRVDENTWYACQNGVWYVATAVNGPWAVAASVPAVIYSIPPDSPLHYLTYVHVYGSTSDYVYEGYTPGYLGTEVADGVVVYGTGYWYWPWVGDFWFGGPITYGCGWAPCWTPWYGWCYGFGFGCGFAPGWFGWNRCYAAAPFWGPYRYWPGGRAAFAAHGGAGVTTAANLFARPGAPGFIGRAGLPRSGWMPGFGRAYNSRTGALVAGQRAAVRNVYASGTARGAFPSNWENRSMFSPGAQSFTANGWGRATSFGFPYASRPAYSYHGYGGYGGAYSHAYGGAFGGGFHGGGYGGGAHGGGFGGGGGHGGGGGGHR